MHYIPTWKLSRSNRVPNELVILDLLLLYGKILRLIPYCHLVCISRLVGTVLAAAAAAMTEEVENSDTDDKQGCYTANRASSDGTYGCGVLGVGV